MTDHTKKGQSQNGKDVIYVDIEEEITGIIDKVRGSDQRIVALVLPKRATVFQSVVNMKLLKRTADEAKKNVVLITSEASLMPLAGSVGVHMAKSLQSKPEIPDAPEKLDDRAETVEEGDELPVDTNKSIGELSGDEEETIELDDIDEENPAEDDGNSSGKKAAKGKSKGLRIPNFNRFRLLILAGGAGLVLLIVFFVMAFTVLPKAQIVIKTNSESFDVSQDVTLKLGENIAVDVEKAVLPAQKEEVAKEMTQEVPATGQLNNGEKATGKIDMTARNCSTLATPSSVAAGTGVTTGGRTYITQEKATFGGGTFDGTCLNFKANNIKITAQGGGAQFNTDSATFAVVGRSDVSATGSASGGTDVIIKVISQADIDSAKQKIGSQDVESVKQELIVALQTKGLRPIESTFNTATPETKQSAKAGDQAEKVVVTQKVAYSMLGVKDEDLKKIIENGVVGKIDPNKQTISDYGLESAILTRLMMQPDGATIGLQATVIAGAELKAEEIKQQVMGKKAKDAEELIKENPGVTDVKVTYSPFWVSSIPNKTSKITVIIEKPEVSSNNDAQSSE